MSEELRSKLSFQSYHTLVVGTGAAGLNAALSLRQQGVTDVALLTENLYAGTSRNTGSDKQTYYKLTTSGSEPDSVRRMAQAMFSGGSMDGDLALAESAVSTRAFYHLVDLGVPFPCNAFGEYVGYKTDHDPCKRGISAGPLTSKYMTECLLKEVQRLGIPVLDHYQVVDILTQGEEDSHRACGILALDLRQSEPSYTVFGACNVIYATGGEAGMYQTSVYPESQIGGTGAALRAGIRGKNLTESQYGISSIKFRWNLSGSYQQVLPCYISTDENGGDAREFLHEFFPDATSLLHAVFLKGYQWPFDPKKTRDFGSSLIDILVYIETVLKNRRVFLDFRRNFTCAGSDGKLDFSLLDEETHHYLEASNAMQDLPIDRLASMNPAAIDLYRSHGIDLYQEPLEIAVCAQHNNGGLTGDRWWQSNVAHFFPVGEVNGSHGVYRPGGSALNAGQVGGIRASQYIAHLPPEEKPTQDLLTLCAGQIDEALTFAHRALTRQGGNFDADGELLTLRKRMSKCGAMLRVGQQVTQAVEESREQLQRICETGHANDTPSLARYLRLRDLAVSQFTYLSAIADYIAQGGKSRGSYLIYDPNGLKPLDTLDEGFRFSLDEGAFSEKIQEVLYTSEGCRFLWRARRPIPEETEWFETVWRDYLSGKHFQ